MFKLRFRLARERAEQLNREKRMRGEPLDPEGLTKREAANVALAMLRIQKAQDAKDHE